MLEDFLKLLGSAFVKLWKNMSALRASGVTFDPEVSEIDNGIYLIELHIYPGNDEVLFEKIRISDCDLAHGEYEVYDNPPDSDVIFIGFTPKRTSNFTSEELSVSIKVDPKTRHTKPITYLVYVKPQHTMKSIRISLSGGLLNKLTAKRYLPLDERVNQNSPEPQSLFRRVCNKLKRLF